MKHCKDCLHYAAHKDFFEKLNGENTFDKFFVDAADYCERFTNCSKYVHLPFSIGDTVWYITGSNKMSIESGQIKSITIGNDYVDILISSSIEGGKVYLTKPSSRLYSSKAEAEKVLEEMR